MAPQLRQPGNPTRERWRSHVLRLGALFILLAATGLFSFACTPGPQEPTARPAATAAPSPTAPQPAAVAASPASLPPSPTTAPPTPSAAPTRAATAAPTATAAAASTATAERPQPPTPVAVAPNAAAERVQGILNRTAALRGLPVKGQVPLSHLGREQLRSYLVDQFEKENSREELAKDKALLVLLDLLREEVDLRELWLGLLTEQTAGFYEFDGREMKLIGSGENLSPFEELTLAHEYVHALQDQNFDLGANMKKARGTGESSLGLRSLAEGDATLAMGAYGRQNLTPEQLAAVGQPSDPSSQEKLRSAPLILQLALLFPYQQGVAFAATLFQSGGWAAVDRAYADPPVTSEQIMHPQKYLAREGPRQVDVPDLTAPLGSQWTLWEDDTFGELDWLAYLASFIPADRAVRSAAGWGGDRTLLFKSATGKHAMASVSLWDTPQDAQEIYSALRDVHRSKPNAKTAYPDNDWLTWSAPSGAGYLGIRDSRVVLVISSDEAAAKRIADALGS